jgi:hypothetical protein
MRGRGLSERLRREGGRGTGGGGRSGGDIRGGGAPGTDGFAVRQCILLVVIEDNSTIYIHPKAEKNTCR